MIEQIGEGNCSDGQQCIDDLGIVVDGLYVFDYIGGNGVMGSDQVVCEVGQYIQVVIV